MNELSFMVHLASNAITVPFQYAEHYSSDAGSAPTLAGVPDGVVASAKWIIGASHKKIGWFRDSALRDRQREDFTPIATAALLTGIADPA
jgi:hypothetical protein